MAGNNSSKLSMEVAKINCAKDENGNDINSKVGEVQDDSISDTKREKELAELSQQYKTLLQMYKNCHSEISKLENEWTSLNNEIEHKEMQHKQLISIHSDRMSQFGNEMVELVQLIKKNEKDFIKKPKGPLGASFSVRSASWIPLIERILSPYLFIFIVDNRQDYEVLLKLIDFVYEKCKIRYPIPNFATKPDVWIAKFTGNRRNLSEARIPVGIGYTTLMDMLEIHNNDPDIFNVLHEFTGFEKVILFNNEHDAFARMAEAFRIPKNCTLGYTRNFLKVMPYPRFRTVALYFCTRSTTYQSESRRSKQTVVTAQVLNRRVLKCQHGLKSTSSLLRQEFDFNISTPGMSSSLLLSNGLINVEQNKLSTSQYYLTPSIKNVVRTLDKKIRELKFCRNLNHTSLKFKRRSRLELNSKLDLIKLQIEDAKNRGQNFPEQNEQNTEA